MNGFPSTAKLQEYESLNDRAPYSASPDDDILRFLALVYSDNHPIMRNYTENLCGSSYPAGRGGFVDGVTNGADWFIAEGKLLKYFLQHMGRLVLLSVIYKVCKRFLYLSMCLLERLTVWDELGETGGDTPGREVHIYGTTMTMMMNYDKMTICQKIICSAMFRKFCTRRLLR